MKCLLTVSHSILFMNCPVCNEKMFIAGIAYVSGDKIMEKWRCPACGHTVEKPRGPTSNSLAEENNSHRQTFH